MFTWLQEVFFYFISYVILLRKGVCSRQGFYHKQWSWILINAFVPQFTHSNRRPVLFTEPALYIHLSSQLSHVSLSAFENPQAPPLCWPTRQSSSYEPLFSLTAGLSVVLAHSGSLWRTMLCAVWQHTHSTFPSAFFLLEKEKTTEWNVSRVSSPISSLLLTYKKGWFDWFKLYEWQNDLCIVETGLQGCHFIPKKIYLGI